MTSDRQKQEDAALERLLRELEATVSFCSGCALGVKEPELHHHAHEDRAEQALRLVEAARPALLRKLGRSR